MEHTTVCVNKYTLQFEDVNLEASFQAFSHTRKKTLWLRSLIPAAISHVVFAWGDSLEHDSSHLQVTLPARLFLIVMQCSTYFLVKWDLVCADEKLMFALALCHGIPTLLLFTLQHTVLHQWDALFVVFGLSFYTIPKVTPLGFVHSMLGSAITVVIYFAIAVFCRPPPNKVEVVLSFLYCAPVIWIFNTISYYSEYSSRERFILRQRLSTERISLAVSRTLNPTPATSSSLASTSTARQPPDVSGTTLFLGVLLWGVFTLGSFASFPETFKFVDEETGWAWFSHIAGVTVFLLVITRRLTLLMVVPLVGAVVLWLMSLVLSSQWIIFSAHSVGYTLLVASAILTFGVFSTFLQAWHQLVAFLHRTCFLYPQLQDGLTQDFPLLDKIVSEYQAGFDPHVLAERQTCQDKLLSDGMDTLTLAGGETDDTHASNTIVSVLPSFKHGKCFFCNKNAIVHYVPTCGLWGKWMHWRMDANHIVAQRGATSSEKIGGLKPTVTMCTSYCDLQSKNRHLQEQMRTLTGSVASLKHQIKLIKEHESRCLTTTVQLQRAMREIADKHKHEMEVAAKVHDAKLQAALKDSNAALVALTQQRDQQRHHVQQLEAALDKETRTRLDADAVHAHLVQRIESQNSRLAQLEVDIFSRKGG
ncbi:hypothetical protein, variant [Aphanomyces invadans]|uniref:Uncharacterized protein n=1 Tax=Aphanomyces invadans TaxID=157072 RepID=A0A024U2F3_9STRA|nr:hypothetical protein, variant [Aphanomyces invadans]ETW00082.1 hypothetical protein, variant [Aphanomyces invadans]|eukprot:XP_008871107.1 hypothetical protein, variant [Aphanomyces invadans]